MANRLIPIPGSLLKAIVMLAILLGVFVGLTAGEAQAATQRHALVIGNDSYRHVERLQNSRSDARAVASALEQSGFRVSVHTDLDLNGLKGVLRTFKAQVNGGDEAVFFFAGHGVEIEGVSYLMPTDIKGDTPDQVKDDAVPLQRVLDDLREKRARFSLAIIDACRNNPFQSTGRSIGGGRGLASPPVATGQMVLYSAGAGQIALDTLGPRDPVRNGVFTRVLLREMAKPGVEVGEVMRSVREEVAALAKSVGREQVPALYDQRLGQFFFRGPVAAVADAQAPASAVPAIDPESRFWDSAQRIDNREAYEAYLAEYPRGRYAALARAAIGRLQSVGGGSAAGYSTSAQTTAPGQPSLEAAPLPLASAPASPALATQATAPPSLAPVRTGLGAPGTVFKDCDECPEMVVIPGGSFLMGSPTGEGSDTERPQRWVQVRVFAMGRFEVTQRQWFAVMGARPSYFSGDDRPVESVSWDDAQTFVSRLSQLTGRRYRLPSEAEWEYAARAGSSTTYPFGSDASRLGEFAWFQANARSSTQPVGRLEPNAFGLHDMLGNVLEWTDDCWNSSYAGAPADGRAWTVGDCRRRVVRGGRWDVNPGLARTAFRYWGLAAFKFDGNGVRIVRTD